MRTLKPGESRALAVLLTFVVLLALVFLISWMNIKAHAHYDEAITDRMDQLARYNRVAAAKADFEQAIKMVKEKDATRFYLKSSTPALAAADIQQIVQTVIEAHGLRTDSIQIAPHKDIDGRRQITLNLRLRGKLQGVRDVLYSLESTQPYLFVENLVVQATVRSNYVPVPGVEPEVTVGFDLSGFAMLKKS